MRLQRPPQRLGWSRARSELRFFHVTPQGWSDDFNGMPPVGTWSDTFTGTNIIGDSLGISFGLAP